MLLLLTASAALGGMPPLAAAAADGAESARGGRESPAVRPSLSSKQVAIPAIAAFAATGELARLHSALEAALDTGLSISEAKEVLIQIYAYAGFPRSLNALSELMTVVEDRRKRGIQDIAGAEPSHPAPTGSELLQAGTVNQTAISGRRVEGAVFDFAPAINQFLRSHLFGDIFVRDNLDWRSRELATVSALAAMTGVEAQLRSHIQASVTVGLSVDQLHELVGVLEVQVSHDAAGRARDALNQYLARAGR